MGINIADNFAYNGKKPMDNRTEYTTLAAMKAVVDANINEGCICYNKEDGKYYTFKSTNTVDATTGKWREFETGGGGGQTYNDFTGATASTAGAHGLVPAPSAGDEGKVLFGNGLWGALPSVDLSVLSNEAFILSATEKAVGMNTDGKLLYAKTIDFGTVTSGDQYLTVDVSGLNIDELVFFLGRINRSSEILSIPCWYIDNQNITWNGLSNNSLTIKVKGFSNGDTVTMTAFYSKTTDSPLPSDVKFAGLLSDGTVVYKKTVATGGSVPSGATLIYRLALLNSTDVVYFTR